MAKPTSRRLLNKYAFATAMLSSTTPLFLGYDLAMVSTAVLAEADLKLLACIVVLSSLMGALAAVGAQCVIGDRRTVLVSAAVLCSGALARGLAVSFAAFTVVAAAVKRAVSGAILSSFAWVYDATTSVSVVHGGLLVCPTVGGFAWLLVCACLLGARGR